MGSHGWFNAELTRVVVERTRVACPEKANEKMGWWITDAPPSHSGFLAWDFSMDGWPLFFVAAKVLYGVPSVLEGK